MFSFVLFCFAALGGVAAVDPRAALAGLPPPDSINLWPYLSGDVAESPRKGFQVDDRCIVSAPYKLLLGAETHRFAIFCTGKSNVCQEARDRHRKKILEHRKAFNPAGNQKGACHSGPHVPNATGNATCATVMYLTFRGIFRLVELPVRFQMGGRPVLSAHLNVETSRSEHNRPKI
jgi:hypothetical protein